MGETMPRKIKIGLALGGGLSRGLAHIGVLKVLHEAKIPLHCIAGTSMGSVIASLYACGMNLKMMEKISRRISRSNWIDFTLPKMGLVAGEKLEQLVYLLTGRRKIEETALPLAVVATDLLTGKRVVFHRGLIAKTVRASCSIPGIFNPVEMEEKLLVDGGVLDRVPVEAVREMGADLVIGVDVSHFVDDYPIHHIFDVLSKTIDIMSREIATYRVQEANLLITPDLRDIAPFQFSQAEETVTRGAEAARRALPFLIDALQFRTE